MDKKEMKQIAEMIAFSAENIDAIKQIVAWDNKMFQTFICGMIDLWCESNEGNPIDVACAVAASVVSVHEKKGVSE